MPLLLPQRLTATEATACLDLLVRNVREGAGAEPVTVDATPLVTFDSAALAVLLEVRRQAKACGRSFSVLNLPASLRTLARVYGVDKLLGPASS